jgi:hypothetical protein
MVAPFTIVRALVEGTAFRADIIVALEVDVVLLDVVEPGMRFFCVELGGESGGWAHASAMGTMARP